MRGQRPFEKLFMTDLLQGIVDSGFPVHHLPIRRGWVEVDSMKDLEIAGQSIHQFEESFRIT